MTFTIPLRSVLGSSLQASKWQKIPLLIDENEMRNLFSALGQFWIVQASGLVSIGEEIVDHEVFLEVYRNYLSSLKRGVSCQDLRVRPYFSSVWTTFPDSLYAVNVNDKQRLVKIQKPVIQLQAHRFDYSYADGTFRSMVMGNESILWGIQFSYPHLYQDENLQVLTVREGDLFPNSALFKKIQHWSRVHTVATPFEVGGKKVNVPIRLGKECLQWINSHPQLQAKGLRVLAG